MKTITLLLVENRDIPAAKILLKEQAELFKPDKTLLITDPKITSLQTYSEFCLTELPSLITTDFVLIIQLDGYILNMDAWEDDFLNYDYIGASWHAVIKHIDRTNESHPHFKLLNSKYLVGNGGFSLRSKKFLQESKILREANSSEYMKLSAEDYYLCVQHGDYMRDKCKFAPIEIADKFSIEEGLYNNQFGFHGNIIFGLPGVYNSL
jgi:hypothetical protein